MPAQDPADFGFRPCLFVELSKSIIFIVEYYSIPRTGTCQICKHWDTHIPAAEYQGGGGAAAYDAEL